MDSLDMQCLPKLEQQLLLSDLVSLSFLLYDNPELAFHKLMDQHMDRSSDMLYVWAQARPNWKLEFLEALSTCQLYSIIRSLNLDVATVKELYPSSSTTHIDPMKKSLYQLCENITSNMLIRLKKSLSIFNIDAVECVDSELIFLQLMCLKFITVSHLNGSRQYKIEKLAKIIENLPGLKVFAEDIRTIEKEYYLKSAVDRSAETPSNSTSEVECESKVCTVFGLTDKFKLFEEMNIEDKVKNLLTDSAIGKHIYPIKNPQRIGVCYIINEEEFYPSKSSIIKHGQENYEPLENRCGSSVDKELLKTTMQSLNYVVISDDNLDHEKIFVCIANVIENIVHHNDSVFMLTLLSHGMLGHVYAADSVEVNIEQIKNFIGEGLMRRGLKMPKIVLIQACQVEEKKGMPDKRVDFNANKFNNSMGDKLMPCNNEIPMVHFVQDGRDPDKTDLVFDGPVALARKGDFVTCYATSPELKAYRFFDKFGKREPKGSIYIQTLCKAIKEYAFSKDMLSILTIVNRELAEFFEGVDIDQVSMCLHSLRKDLYLQMPKIHTLQAAP